MPHPALQPLRFEPFLRPMVWGGRRLGRYLGKNLAGTATYGESWEVSDHAMHVSRLATASGFGTSIHQLMAQERKQLLGASAPGTTVFPWLIKLLDCHDWLSVQVHPDEIAVQKLWPDEAPKTEAWYVLDADLGAKIYAGFRPGVDESQLRKALEAGTVADCLNSFTPQRGDLVYLPAGTVHAVGGGVLMAEVQQTSDTTFRLFDWSRVDAHGKSRTLHLEEAFACIDWSQGPVHPLRGESARKTVQSKYFEIAEIRWNADDAVGGSGQMQTLIVAEGHGRFANGEFFMPGDAWILPAAMPTIKFHLEAPVVGLLATLPITA